MVRGDLGSEVVHEDRSLADELGDRLSLGTSTREDAGGWRNFVFGLAVFLAMQKNSGLGPLPGSPLLSVLGNVSLLCVERFDQSSFTVSRKKLFSKHIIKYYVHILTQQLHIL